MKYQFDQYALDTVTQELSNSGEPVALEPQVFALIELLVANADRVVSKDELNERIWGGRIVSDAAVNSRLRSARQAIGDSGAAQQLIKTIRGRGFRFVGKVVQSSIARTDFTPPRREPHPAQEITAGTNPAVAVLPFKLVSLDTRYEPLADAIALEVISDLSRLHWLKVISGSSTLRLHANDRDIAHVARLLGVDYVLSGSLALFGEQADVIVELTNVKTMAVVWSNNFKIKVDQLIELRAELASGIANSIEQRVQSEEARLADNLATEDLDAWTTYFRALRHVNRFNKHDNEIGMHLFERAIELDPGFALAHAGLSFAHFQSAFVGYDQDLASRQADTLRYAERSIELDPLDPTANLTMGRAKYLLGQWEQANPWFERSAKICPNNALAYYNQALVSTVSGTTHTTHNLSERALTLSPIDPLQYAFLGTRSMGHLANGDFENAAYWGEQAANAPRAHHLIEAIAAAACVANGQSDKGQDFIARLNQRVKGFTSDQFFQSLPVHPKLHEQISKSFAVLGID